ncbi:MAG: S1 RNA-binding domain-containing protein [Planctomycetaceae bacterium]|nr:S1 RNA-binding domain-containing protein [Planctomycetaceae bacterium]
MSSVSRPNMPRVRVRELDQFFRDLRETVLALEQAYVQGTLAEQLKHMAIESRFGNGLARSYRFLLKASRLPDPEGLRRNTVHALLDQTRDELFETDIWFHADIQAVPVTGESASQANPTPATTVSAPDLESNSLDVVDTSPPPELAPIPVPEGNMDYELEGADTILAEEDGVDGREDVTEVLEDLVPVSSLRYVVSQGLATPVSLRLDQVLAARSWGVGFFFNDMEETDRVADLRARLALEHLARDLLDLSRMLPRLLRGKPGQYPPLVPPRFSRAAEQLIVDIVNEHEANASLSRLCEDYLQKTDLRVRFPGLQRRRGARVQVTLGPTQSHHQQKIDTIRNPDHFVILSPWALATAIPHFGSQATGNQVPMDHDLVRRFWRSLSGQPASLESLAYTIRGILHTAIHSPILDPRGPLALVPEAVRELIRAWVKHEAFRSTSAMREWEETQGEFFRRSDGRLGTRPLLNPKAPSALKRFLEANPVGSRVLGRVHAVGPRSAIIDLGNAVLGKISREEISWSTTQAKLKLFLNEGQEYEFVVTGGGRSTLDLVDLSRKRLQPDPWAAEDLGGLTLQKSVSGRVQSQTPFGLFVELRPDVVGLLHRSTIPDGIHETVWKLYPKDATIEVTVLAMDLDNRRISLALAPKVSAT